MTQWVTFLSDFGLEDSYVAEVKAVLLSRVPGIGIVDITHQVASYQVEWAAFQLRRSYSYFPKGTLHLAIVDPGVGTLRKNLYIKTRDYAFVGPDNGVLAWAVEQCEAREGKAAQRYEIPVPPGIAPTFYGRDVFAPFIASLLRKEAGKLKRLKQMVGRPFPKPQKEKGVWKGEILGWDQFGNVITNIEFVSQSRVQGRIAGLRDPIFEANNYLAIEAGKVGLIRGSHGFWEIACRMGSAADLLRVKPGDSVTVFSLKSK